MPIPLDIVMFDTGVLMGTPSTIKFLQQSLNIRDTGIIDQQLWDVLSGADPFTVAARHVDLREARLRAIVRRDPTQRKFLRGWLSRLNDLRRTAAHPAPNNRAMDEIREEELYPVEGVAAGRAIIDLPEDYQEKSSDKPRVRRKLSFLETTDVASFLEAAAPIADRGRRKAGRGRHLFTYLPLRLLPELLQ
jgi:hypothetical protein